MISKIAMLSAISVVLMLIEFPLPFLPPFYKLDFSEITVMIGGFALGPMAAVIIEFLKVTINLLFSPTQTMFVGEFANFLIGCSFTVPASLIYYKHKSRKSALIGMVTGTFIMILVGAVLNAFVLLPVYAWAFNMPLDALIAMGTELNANITSIYSFVVFATSPLNLIKGVSVTAIVMLIYKRVSNLLKR